MEKTVSRKKILKFTNMEARRVGKGIKTLRKRVPMSVQQLADAVGISSGFLDRLEEGYIPEVERWILESISQTVGVRKRGNGLTDERLLDIFLCSASVEPPKLL